MAHLFISYSRSDRARIEKLSEALEAAGHTVWWDRHIKGGASFSKNIEDELKKSDAVVVAWSADANESDWVKDEAVFARDHKKLIPICLSECEAPIGFRQIQAIDFQKWKGDRAGPEFASLLAAVADITKSDAPQMPTPSSSSFMDKARSTPVALIGGAAIALLILVGGYFFFRSGSDDGTEVAEVATVGQLPFPEEMSIAVLPFADMSPEGNQEYFADGLSEELLNVLVRVDGLKVASRTSSFALKNEILSISEIAERLKVHYVLEGSVRKMDNRIRITAQLIDARDDRHLWSETYDRHLSDIFRIQDEIGTAILGEMREELNMPEGVEIVIRPDTENMSAYDMYLRARELFIARGSKNVRESLRLFEEVTALDPNFARGWEGLAAVYAIATSWGILDRDYSALSLVAAKQALDIDPDLSMPYAVMGLTYRTHYPTPWAESIGNLEKAIEQDAKNSNAWLWLGMNQLAVGNLDQAVGSFNQCLDIDDAARLCRKYRSISNLAIGETKAAIADAEANAAIGYFSDFDVFLPYFLSRSDRITAYAISRNIYWWDGFPHPEFIAAIEAESVASTEIAKKIIEWGEANNVNMRSRTYVMLTLGAYDQIDVESFDNDYEDIWLPQFSDYRQSDDFKQLATNLGLVDYWRDTGFPRWCEPVGEDDFTCR